ncbi:hypothetical protein GIB67_043114 [Kingdonia uniflora]|uniref:Aminotransferase-like plant mobile domain-containing protein n=1 Tax=Kingdonia uniflora TaxID=39325 RepID=A0A7J7NJH3_9MAGN|nr:hypothetical protein GIB67_043114 [Kingdonia uniflora]
MNEDNVEVPSMSKEPQTEVSQEEIAAPIDDTYPPDRSLLLSFKFHRARSIYLGQDKANIKWSWGSVVLAHLFHNLGAASRTDGKQFAAYMTLLESWIFAHFPKLPGITKEQHSNTMEYCTRWKWGLSITDRTGVRELLKYRETFDNYKVEDGLWKEWIVRSRDRGRRLSGRGGGPAQCVEGYMQWFQSVSWTKICPPTVDLSADDDIGLSACHPIGRVRSKSNNCDVPMEVSGEVPNVCEREQYLMWRDENKVLVEHISALKEEVQKMKDQKKQKQENEKERYEMIIEKLTENLRARIEQMKQDRELNDVVHEQYVKSFEKLPAKLEEKLAVIPKREAVPSRDLQKKIDELTVKYDDAVKRLKEKESFEAWRQAMKKEFYSGELSENDDPTFIELFDQYDKFYTIAQQGPKGDYQEDFTVTGGNQDKLMDVRRAIFS